MSLQGGGQQGGRQPAEVAGEAEPAGGQNRGEGAEKVQVGAGGRVREVKALKLCLFPLKEWREAPNALNFYLKLANLYVAVASDSDVEVQRWAEEVERMDEYTAVFNVDAKTLVYNMANALRTVFAVARDEDVDECPCTFARLALAFLYAAAKYHRRRPYVVRGEYGGYKYVVVGFSEEVAKTFAKKLESTLGVIATLPRSAPERA